MKSAWLIAALLAGCGVRNQEPSALNAGGDQVGRFKGYVAIDETLAGRMTTKHLGAYLGVNGSDFSGLETLLGGYQGDPGSSVFRNGDPNSMNMLLWQLSLGLLAGDAAKNCVAPLPAGALPLSPAFAATLKPLCAWPAAGAKAEANLLALWTGLAGYAAPRAEYEAWRDYFVAPASPYATTPAKDTVSAMLTGIFLNPNFLLER